MRKLFILMRILRMAHRLDLKPFIILYKTTKSTTDEERVKS